MTIAFVSTIRSPWGGSEELWAACAELAIRDHTVVISAMDCGELSPKVNRLLEHGARLDLRIGTIRGGLPAWKRVYLRLLRMYGKTLGNPFAGLEKYRPDILLYVGSAYSIADDHKLLDVIRRTKTAFFINVQLNTEGYGGELTGRQKRIVDRGYTAASELFFVSQRNREVAEKAVGSTFPRATVVRNPVNLDSTDCLPMPAGEKTQFALVGNLRIVHKGQDLALEALSTAKWMGRDWHLNIYGSGEDEQRLRSMVDFFRLKNNVTFHGRVSDIREVWRVNHVLVMPSRMEGMPLAIVEAMLCGRPCVATDVGGVTEWIEDGLSGFIAEAATGQALDRALERAWEARDQWGEIGVRAHERAIALYDPAAGKTLLDRITKP
jgi:glycosyltransferase involved in cell wall biosynthesis